MCNLAVSFQRLNKTRTQAPGGFLCSTSEIQKTSEDVMYSMKTSQDVKSLSVSVESTEMFEEWHGRLYWAMMGAELDVTAMSEPARIFSTATGKEIVNSAGQQKRRQPPKRIAPRTVPEGAPRAFSGRPPLSNTGVSNNHTTNNTYHSNNNFTVPANDFDLCPSLEERLRRLNPVTEKEDYWKMSREWLRDAYQEELLRTSEEASPITIFGGNEYEDFNFKSYRIAPEVAAKLPAPCQFSDPDSLNNPWGCFVGYDGGARCSYWGSWDVSKYAKYAKQFENLVDRHKAICYESGRFVPIGFSFVGSEEKWFFRCAGGAERSSFGFSVGGSDFDVFVLEREGLKIYLFPPDSTCMTSGDAPDVVLVIGEQSFRNCVPATAVEKVALEVLSEIGFTPSRQKVQRVDLQITTNLISVSEVQRLDNSGCIVSRARSRAYFVSKNNPHCSGKTIYFGKRESKVMLRVYDKLGELAAHAGSDRGRKSLFVLACLGDDYYYTEDMLTRFEFELHSEFLKEYKVESFADLEQKMPSIVEYLTQEWFVICNKEKDGSHYDRLCNSVTWEKISGALKNYAAYVANNSGGVINVTRARSDKRPKTVRSAEEFLTRAAAEMCLALGCDNIYELTPEVVGNIAEAVFARNFNYLREYVAASGEGYRKERHFLEFDIKQFLQRTFNGAKKGTPDFTKKCYSVDLDSITSNVKSEYSATSDIKYW